MGEGGRMFGVFFQNICIKNYMSLFTFCGAPFPPQNSWWPHSPVTGLFRWKSETQTVHVHVGARALRVWVSSLRRRAFPEQASTWLLAILCPGPRRDTWGYLCILWITVQESCAESETSHLCTPREGLADHIPACYAATAALHCNSDVF